MTRNTLNNKSVNKTAEQLAKLDAKSKATGVSGELINILVNHNCTVIEARELMKTYFNVFDEAIQKHPSKANEILSKNLFQS